MTAIDVTDREIISEFELFGDWQERYEYLIELGRKLEPLPADLRTESNMVRGCQSQVWLHTDVADDRIVFRAASDSTIVAGLIALLLRVYSDRRPEEIVGYKPQFIDRLGLAKHLSITRSNGLAAMLKTIQERAAMAAAGDVRT